MLIALLEHYDGWSASDTYLYHVVAGEPLRKPSTIQLARRSTTATRWGDELLLPDGRQRLSDTLEAIVDIPGVDVNSGVDRSVQQAQRLLDRFQRTFDDVIQT